MDFETKDYQEFVKKIKNYIEIDLSLYKEGQMKRRISSLREKRGYNSFQTYFEALKKDKELRDEFLDRITINVTEFFRNKTCWDKMSEKIIPDILKRKKQIKIWSAACSTGEEPYTTVMVLSKFLPLSEIKIIATDIDDEVLKRAKKGVYTENSMKNLPEDFKRRFFVEKEGVYIVKDEIKRCVQFKKQNLLRDRFEKGFDLIICRNVMIYFTEEAKDKLYRDFSDSLSEDGILFVGSTEQIFYPENYNFKTVETFFYQKKR